MKKFIAVFVCISFILAVIVTFFVIRSALHTSESASTDSASSEETTAPVIDSSAMVPITSSDPTEDIPGVSADEPIPASPGVTKLVFTGDVELSPPVQAKYDGSGVSGVVSD